MIYSEFLVIFNKFSMVFIARACWPKNEIKAKVSNTSYLDIHVSLSYSRFHVFLQHWESCSNITCLTISPLASQRICFDFFFNCFLPSCYQQPSQKKSENIIVFKTKNKNLTSVTFKQSKLYSHSNLVQVTGKAHWLSFATNSVLITFTLQRVSSMQETCMIMLWV